MQILTWGELKAIIKSELDLDEETFIDDTELRNLGNKAIDEAEQHVLLIYQDYFRTKATLTLVEGQSSYPMPADIYANKIRLVYYANGSNKYKIGRIRMKDIPHLQGSEDYQFDIEQGSSVTPNDAGIRFVLYPQARESGPYVTMWYIRNAARLTSDSSNIEIPEAVNFIRAYVAAQVFMKEMSPMFPQAQAELNKQTQLLKETLDAMIPDEDETLEQDLSFYEEFNTDHWRGW